jgi:hypothetical protein
MRPVDRAVIGTALRLGARCIVLLAVAGCAPLPAPATSAPAADTPLPVPARVVPGYAWRAEPAVGYHADALRRNLREGETVMFRDLTVRVEHAATASPGAYRNNVAQLRLRRGRTSEVRTVDAGTAFTWRGYRIAVLAIPGPGELGAGFVSLELATKASLPPHVADAPIAGGAAMRLRVPHRITHITLHHTGSARPLDREDDPVRILQNLHSWSMQDRNWWDVPYHYLIDLDGNVYEGRDWRYMGETNTGYDPGGHLLISVIGNYELQEPTAAQIDAIIDMMTWAAHSFGIGTDRIGGHYHYAQTACPGTHLRRLLEDGTLHSQVKERLQRR